MQQNKAQKYREQPVEGNSNGSWSDVPVVYTDGACTSNGHASAAAGIGVFWGEEHVDNISEPLAHGPPTNNRAEFTAVIRALETSVEGNSNGSWSDVPVVYTDGACTSNGHASAAAGIGVFWGEEHVDNISEPLAHGPPTNNRAEFTAVIRALETAISRQYQRLIVRTDSKLLIQTMTSWINLWRKNGWKTANGRAVLNQDLICRLDELLKTVNVSLLYH
ncbi:unnamed protein product [Gongylonema pulchrum]|uniref:ribonuclease H n=1 Tax=Gongylonema pulchrum TaxID=637853 RepID=A0A183DUV4_9BILA|nr:unnamed protein product [Gongylonema pulchrum]